MTWFFLISTSLIDLYAAKSALMNLEREKQSELLTAEELFYKARNFEFDFYDSVYKNQLDSFYSYWEKKGDLNYGKFDYDKKTCTQSGSDFTSFINNRKIIQEDVILFENGFCVTLDLDDGGFKTSGAIVSPVCINTSSPYFLC